MVQEDKSGNIWFGTDGLDKYNPITGELTYFLYDPNDPKGISSDYVISICEDNYGYFWIGTDNGLNRLNPSTGVFNYIFENPADSFGLRSNNIREALLSQTGDLWVVSRETGLQLYKFGKVASMPAWKKSFEPDSFMEIVKENKSINAHSLILIDIGLGIQDALEQLEKSAENHNVKLDKLVVCQSLGTRKQKIFYKTFEELKEFTGVRKPYCLIIPGKLHHVEAEVLERFE